MNLLFHKVLALPANPDPDAVYFVLSGDDADTWVTDEFGTPKHVGNITLIGRLIAEQLLTIDGGTY